jgi:hypothetical protein
VTRSDDAHRGGTTIDSTERMLSRTGTSFWKPGKWGVPWVQIRFPGTEESYTRP